MSFWQGKPATGLSSLLKIKTVGEADGVLAMTEGSRTLSISQSFFPSLTLTIIRLILRDNEKTNQPQKG
jgi:hypothetical protein